MKKKILVFALALALATPALAKTKFNPSNNANNATSFTVASVSPPIVENNVATTLTITGTGFSPVNISGVKLGAWQDDANDNTDDSFILENFTLGDGGTTITAIIPAGAPAGNNQDITVFDTGADPDTHYTLPDAVTIHPSLHVNDQDGDNDGVVEVFQSNSKNTKINFTLTVKGKIFKNKRWLKMRVGNKKAVISKISRNGNDTIITAKFKYGKLAVGSYNIRLTYKDRMTKGVANSKNKVRYRTSWEKGTMTMNNAFSVMSQLVQ